ncbi:MAG: hypothetical protein Q4D71_09960 [Oscillospiraceae bacterium]|nr:hypothetical protein [Oscillospiraceae bacterium]
MGTGYSYNCIKCGHKYSVYPGIGAIYPHVYRKKLAEIAEGACGAEWKDLLEKTPYAAIDAETVIYICSSCNRWETGTDITLYAPDDPESISKKQYGIKTVEEWGYVPYVTDWHLEKDYHVLKRYYHKCEKCGRRMHKASEAEMQNLPCPECGEPNRSGGIIMWD